MNADAIAIAVLGAVVLSWMTFDTWYGFLRRLPSRVSFAIARARFRCRRGPGCREDRLLADWELRAWLDLENRMRGHRSVTGSPGHPLLRRKGDLR